MTIVLELLAGLVLGLGLIGYARGKPWRDELRVLATALFVAALVYVALAVAGGATAWWLSLEAAGVLVFGAAAWVGLRHWPVVLAIAWAAHVLWDVGLHLDGAGAGFTPPWYPLVCASFDLVVAGAILRRMPRVSASRPAV